MTIRKFSALLFAITCALASGCDDDDGGQGEGESTGASDRSSAILALEGDVSAGATVFATNSCSSDACHGADGTSGNAMPMLSTSVPLASEIQIVTTFLNGKGSMPPQSTLTDQQLADVLAYVVETFG